MTKKSITYMSSGLAAALALNTSIATAQVTPTSIDSGDNS